VNPLIDRKQNRRKIRTVRRVAEITGKQIEYSGNALLFFLQRENDELTPDLLHKKFGGNTLKFILLGLQGKVKQMEEKCS